MLIWTKRKEMAYSLYDSTTTCFRHWDNAISLGLQETVLKHDPMHVVDLRLSPRSLIWKLMLVNVKSKLRFGGLVGLHNRLARCSRYAHFNSSLELQLSLQEAHLNSPISTYHESHIINISHKTLDNLHLENMEFGTSGMLNEGMIGADIFEVDLELTAPPAQMASTSIWIG